MRLISVYDVSSDLVLYRLLEERRPDACISHKRMPSWNEHKEFLESHPYEAWYLIMESVAVLGAAYLTRNSEIGIFLFEKHRGKGCAAEAVQMLMDIHPRNKFLANINPDNGASMGVFKKLGFTHIQETYELNV